MTLESASVRIATFTLFYTAEIFHRRFNPLISCLSTHGPSLCLGNDAVYLQRSLRFHQYASSAPPNRRIFAYVDTGILDGIQLDTEGNMFSMCTDVIE